MVEGLETRIGFPIEATGGAAAEKELAKPTRGVATLADKVNKLASSNKTLSAETLASREIQKKSNEIAQKFGVTTSRLKQGLNAMNWEVTKEGEIREIGNKKIIAMNKAQRAVIGSTSRFRMELLSLMFISMGVYRVIKGMVMPVLELTGVTDVYASTLQNALLPVLYPVSDKLVEIADAFDRLDPSVKNVLASSLLLFGVLSGIVLVLTQLGLLPLKKLFVTTIAPAFKFLWGIVSGVFNAIVGMGAAFVIALIFLIIGLVLSWKENFANFREWVQLAWEGIKNIFKGAFMIISNLFGAFVALLSGDFDDFFRHLWGVIEGIGTMILGWLEFCLGVIFSLGIGAFRGLVYFIELVGKAISWIGNKLADLIEKVPGLGGVAGVIRAIAGQFALPVLPTRQIGGIIPTTGLYRLHAGETVTPAGFTTSPTINVYANVSSDIDVRKLAERISSIWISEFEKYSRTRGSL